MTASYLEHLRCLECGGPFTHEPRPGTVPIYCSPSCGRQWRAKHRRRARPRPATRLYRCAVCAGVFARGASSGRRPSYCSRRCKRLASVPALECQTCGATKVQRPGQWRRWCSDECRPERRRRGKATP